MLVWTQENELPAVIVISHQDGPDQVPDVQV